MERRRTKKYIKISIISVVLFILIGYAAFQARNIVAGPKITIASPADASVATTSLITVSGVTKNLKRITLNGSDIHIDETGAFSEKLLLSYGYTIMTVEGWDAFGHGTKKTLEVLYK